MTTDDATGVTESVWATNWPYFAIALIVTAAISGPAIVRAVFGLGEAILLTMLVVAVVLASVGVLLFGWGAYRRAGGGK